MARRNLRQEQFRRKYHTRLVQRSLARPGWKLSGGPKHGSAKQAIKLTNYHLATHKLSPTTVQPQPATIKVPA